MSADLLDTLAVIEGPPVHSVLPDMTTACGADLLTLLAEHAPLLLGTRGTLMGPAPADEAVHLDAPTCPACRTAFGDLDGLRDVVARAQQRQAVIEP